MGELEGEREEIGKTASSLFSFILFSVDFPIEQLSLVRG